MALQLPSRATIYEADPFGSFTKGLGLGRDVLQEQQAKAALEEYAKSLYGNDTGVASSTSAVTPASLEQMVLGSHNAAEKATDPALTGYFAAARASESGGNDAARNPNSSATGRYQFLEGTWKDLMARHPELGLTPDGMTDPAQQERAMRAFTTENASGLKAAGQPVNPGTLYAAHFLGAKGASDVLGLPDETPMAQAVGAEVIQANPQLAQMTVGQFKQWSAEKGGSPAGGYMAPQAVSQSTSAPADAGMSSNGLPPRDVMVALFRNPATREFAAGLAKATQAGEKLTDDQREYAGAVAQGYQGTFMDYKEALKSGGNSVTVNTGEGADSELNKALSKAEGEAWAALKTTASVSGANSADFGVLDELIKVAPQGPIAGRLAEAFPGFSSAGDAFQSIVKRIAPTLRAPGSGATSDIEYDGMLKSLPALKNNPDANKAILEIMRAKADLNIQRAQVVTDYQNGVLQIGEARARMNELDRTSIITPELRAALDGISGGAPAVDPELQSILDKY